MDDVAIRFEHVTKRFGAQVVLDDVSLAFPAGKTTVIAGGSGQGKSVTLKLILGLLQPDTGRIFVEGENIVGMGRRRLNEVRRKFGVLFQGAALLDSLTVFENVALPLEERTSLSQAEIRQRVTDTLAQFDLAAHADKYPAQLSGGMRKRVGLARALQLEPSIMLFDEPTTGLDPLKAMDIYDLFYHTQHRYGFTSIIVSHDIPKIFNLADQVVILAGGRFVVLEDPSEIWTSDRPEIQDLVNRVMGTVYNSKLVEATP